MDAILLIVTPFHPHLLYSNMRQTGMIHNVLVTKDTGTIILTQYYLLNICIILRYWDGSQAAERGKFEHNLYLQTLQEWSEIKPNKEDVDKVDQYKTHVALVEYVLSSFSSFIEISVLYSRK